MPHGVHFVLQEYSGNVAPEVRSLGQRRRINAQTEKQTLSLPNTMSRSGIIWTNCLQKSVTIDVEERFKAKVLRVSLEYSAIRKIASGHVLQKKPYRQILYGTFTILHEFEFRLIKESHSTLMVLLGTY